MRLSCHSALRGTLVLACVLTSTGATCARPGEAGRSDRDTSGTTAATAGPGAEEQFRKFLSLAIVTRAKSDALYDSVFTCRDFQSYQDSRWIADYRVLSVAQRSDTLADVAAVLTTVARLVNPGDDRYRATMRVAEDTAHWMMLRTPATHQLWMVCGDAREGFSTFIEGRDVSWSPPGASRDRAFALADSVRRARGLSLVR